MGKLYSIITALLLTAGIIQAVTPDSYEWWFDNDASSVQTGTVSGKSFDLLIDTSDLPKGIHYFNIRLAKGDSIYGSVYRRMFHSFGSDNSAVSYEYWFDNDIDSKISGDISSGKRYLELDLSSLPKGIHFFNCRVGYGNGVWGPVYRKMFQSIGQDNSAISYEYWFDNDYASKVSGDIPFGSNHLELDISSLPAGVHYFNCRLGYIDGSRGSVYRKMIVNLVGSDDAVAYEYWIDDNYNERFSGELSSEANTYEVDLTGIRKGLHRISYRIQTCEGVWGAPFMKYFFIESNASRFTEYEYWFDNDYLNRVSSTADGNPASFEVDLSDFDKSCGAHYFNLRLRDDDGDWSSVYRKLIVFYSDSMRAPVTGYRHYINGIDLGFVEVERTLSDSYTFTVDLPDSLQFHIAGQQPRFEDDRITVESSDSARYIMQLRTELGWAPPEMWKLEIKGSYSAVVTDMKVNSIHQFSTPGQGEFAAIRFTADSTPLYLRTDIPVTLDLWRDGVLEATVSGESLNAMICPDLPAGVYYGILRDAAPDSPGQFTFYLTDMGNQVSAPSIGFRDLMIEIQSEQMEGTSTYYTLDGSEPSESSTLYDSPFVAPESDATILARSYRAGFNPSEIAEYSFVRAEHTVAAPLISVTGNIVTLTAVTEGSTIWYSIGNDDTSVMSEYSGPVAIEGNLTIYAQGRKAGMYDSETVWYAMTGQTTAKPYGEFNREEMLLTLRCATPGAAISYAVNDSTGEWATYAGPITVEGNCTVYARAKAPDYLESETAEILIRQFICAGVTVSNYDGRYITLATGEPDAEIRYTFSDGNPAEGIIYDGAFDAGGLVTVRAVAVKQGYMDSEPLVYSVEGYADENHAVTSRPGILASCYGWAPEGMPDETLRLAVAGELDETDYSFIRSLHALRYLDLTDVTSAVMPDGALASTGLVTVDMPAAMNAYGNGVFAGNPGLCAIVWHSAALRVDGRLTEGTTNPNLLMYLPYGDPTGECGVMNRIENGYASAIRLTDRYPFHAPQSFTAREISYTRHFSKPTIIGTCAGWETIALPFRVETINDAVSEIRPFATAKDDDRPFWLYRPTAAGWEMTGEILAYEPYLISMPNNPEYIDSYNILGEVRFSATNAAVEATPEPEGKPCFSGSLLFAEFGGRTADEQFRIINDEKLDGNEPGSVFVGGLRDVRPFECFMMSNDSRRMIPIFDNSSIEELMSWQGVKIWTEGNELCIRSAVGCRIPVYDLKGVPVRMAEVRSGEVCRVRGLDTGIYIVCRSKVIIR